MRSARRIRHAVLLAIAALSVSLVSPAQERRSAPPAADTGGRGYSYEFVDDPLNAGGIGPSGGVIKAPNRRVRMLLIRPRTQFVTEMLKSVENL